MMKVVGTRKLPGWVVDPKRSVREKCEPYRHMTPEERARDLWDVCSAAAQLLALNTNRSRVLSLQDPLPESSRRALARLRSQAHGRD